MKTWDRFFYGITLMVGISSLFLMHVNKKANDVKVSRSMFSIEAIQIIYFSHKMMSKDWQKTSKYSIETRILIREHALKNYWR